MARAKRTDRAEARRRYRSEQALGDRRRRRGSTTPVQGQGHGASAPGPRCPGAPRPRGVGNAFRAAFRPLDLREDLRALPQLIRHGVVDPGRCSRRQRRCLACHRDPAQGRGHPRRVTVFLFQYFIVTPAIGGVFIAGFLAPRASWLLGVIVGIVAAACAVVPRARCSIGIAPTPRRSELARDVILASFLLSPIVGAFFASATAAWYRRFLALSNPNARPGPAQRRPPRAPTAARDARSSQKASARR